MTKRELKMVAQDRILTAISGAFYSVSDDPDLNAKDREAVIDELDRQFRRVEKLFGYEPGSWLRG